MEERGRPDMETMRSAVKEEEEMRVKVKEEEGRRVPDKKEEKMKEVRGETATVSTKEDEGAELESRKVENLCKGLEADEKNKIEIISGTERQEEEKRLEEKILEDEDGSFEGAEGSFEGGEGLEGMAKVKE